MRGQSLVLVEEATVADLEGIVEFVGAGLLGRRVVSTKAGYDMWPGPYGDRGSRKYLLASLDQSLRRLGLDYVDIHRIAPTRTPRSRRRWAPSTPAVRQGKALYAGISSYSPERTREAAAILERLGTPLLIHQPSYSMLNRWIEDGLLDVLGELHVGCIGFSPLAQGLSPTATRTASRRTPGSHGLSLDADQLNEQTAAKIAGLREIATARSQPLAAMALAWTLRDPRMTSTLVGASSVEQLEQNVRALDRLDFSDDELAAIDGFATESDINLWAQSSEV